jgi:hypothetical protein
MTHARCRTYSVLLLLLLVVIPGSGCVEVDRAVRRAQESLATSGQLDEQTVIAGLKEALKVGTERTVLDTSSVDGFLDNALIRIALPEQYDGMANTLRKVGLGRYVDELAIAMNRSAEQAAGEAREVFWSSITAMGVGDAYGILKGNDTAATDYFRLKTAETLRQRFEPIVRSKMAQVELYQVSSQLISHYNAIPFVEKPAAVNLDDYVTEKTLSGLFTVLAQEEKKIRQDPAARTTELLKKVFSER